MKKMIKFPFVDIASIWCYKIPMPSSELKHSLIWACCFKHVAFLRLHKLLGKQWCYNNNYLTTCGAQNITSAIIVEFIFISLDWIQHALLYFSIPQPVWIMFMLNTVCYGSDLDKHIWLLHPLKIIFENNYVWLFSSFCLTSFYLCWM